MISFFTISDRWYRWYLLPYIAYVYEPNQVIKHVIEIGWLFFGLEFYKDFKGNQGNLFKED